MTGARRLLLRAWPRFLRRALPGLCLWMALISATPLAAQQITAATYAQPTSIYPHGVLGDDKEWGAIRITVSRQADSESSLFDGQLKKTYQIEAPPQTVFEDTQPRLWDVDGDGKNDVVVVISHLQQGAQLAVIGYRDGGFRYIATTPTIGQRFRWLAPVGAADLDEDGHIEVAFVHTPHLGKTLHIWRYRNGDFSPVTQHGGLTNHQIGWDHIPGGLRVCGDMPELVTANANWTRMMASSLQNGTVLVRDIGPYTTPAGLNAVLQCQ